MPVPDTLHPVLHLFANPPTDPALPFEMNVVKNWSDIPKFETEQEEARYWADTRLDTRLMNGSLLKTDARESTTVTLRFDPRMLARIKRLARSRYLNYQSMIKQWLSERIEKEGH